jgi:hypothetical protein
MCMKQEVPDEYHIPTATQWQMTNDNAAKHSIEHSQKQMIIYFI